jgi:hypothetical protein
LLLLSRISEKNKSIILLIYIAENIETIIHIANISQNHLIIFIQKIYNIIATINQVTFESQIADHDFLNQTIVACLIFFHSLISSFTRSNIKILASIAIQTERINHATEAKVKTIQKDFTIDKTINTYINKAIEDINQDNLYTIIKNKDINKNQENHAIIIFCKEDDHNLESIVFSDVR